MTTKRGVTFKRLFPVKVVRGWVAVLYLSATLFSALLITPGTMPLAQAAYTVTGTVFRDYNANGTRDSLDTGIGGVTVTATDATGAIVATAVTSSSAATIGQYTLNITSDGPVRIEFPSLPTDLKYGPYGKDNGTSVTFVSGAQVVNLGINNPSLYCQDNPDLATNCYVFGDAVNGPNRNSPAVVGFSYTASGRTPTPSDLAESFQVGSTWGVAYHRYTRTILAGAFLKRHSSFGPNGTGAIYRISRTGGQVSLFLDLNTIFGAGTAGADPHPLGTGIDFRRDSAAFDQVGKVALGGLTLSNDDQTLFAINLNDRSLYKIPVGPNLTVPPTSLIGRYPTPTSGQCPSPNDMRPFAVEENNGLIYVGVICTAESTQNPADLRGFVFVFDPNTNAFNANPVLSFGLNYQRGCINFADAIPTCATDPLLTAGWHPWTNKFPTVVFEPYGGYGGYPQPMFTGITFDNGDIIIGLRDRFGDQTGYRAGNTDPNDPNFIYTGITAGELLRACTSGAGSWTLENNGSCGGRTTGGAGNNKGPGGGEYYYQQNFPNGPHDYLTEGAVAKIPALPEVITTVFDPLNDKSRYFSGGTRVFNSLTATTVRNYEIYPPSAQNGTFGKANGLGDLQLLCDAAPLEIGNRVWIDSNKNGIQDPGELPIGGVTVRLYDATSGALVATTKTNANGEYYFNASNVPNGVKPNYNYFIRLDNPADYAAGGPLYTYTLTLALQGTNRFIDNNGTLVNGYPQTNLRTGTPGDNNHTYDFGFYQVPPTPTTHPPLPTDTPTPFPRRSETPSVSPPSTPPTATTTITPSGSATPPSETPNTPEATPTATPTLPGSPPDEGPPSTQPPLAPPGPKPPNTGKAIVAEDSGTSSWWQLLVAGLLITGGSFLLYRGFGKERRR